MRITFSDQYGINCVIVETGDTAAQVLDHCWKLGAVRQVDGVEFCVQLRPEVGPELWTGSSLRRSLAKERSWQIERYLAAELEQADE